MANKIKYNSGIDAGSLNSGVWSIGSMPGMGPSSSTGFKTGVEIPTGGYAIYSPGVNVRTASNDAELVEILNKLGANSTSLGDAVLWARSNNILVLSEFLENIAYDGLIAYLDANQKHSHVINEETINILEISGAGGLSSRSDIYHRATKTDLGGGKYRFVNNGTGGSTIRLYVSQTNYIPDETYTCSISYEDFQPGTGSSLTLDWCDRGATSFSVNTYGTSNRVSITSSRADNPHYFFDISIAPGAAITLFDAQVELGSEETPYVEGTRSENNWWYDLTNNGMNARLNHNTDLDPVEGAIEFDGVNDYATIDSNPASEGSTFTFEVWFKREGIATTTAPYDRIFQKNGGYSGFPNYGYELSESENSTLYVRFAHSPAGGDYSSYSANSFSFGATDASKNHIKMDIWYCAITTVDENNFSRTWVNGQLAGEQQLAQPVMPEANSIYIARGDNREFQGGVSKVRIYNRALTESEALQNYYGGPIVTNGLFSHFDASNKVCYTQGNSYWYNMALGNVGTIYTETEYSSNKGGALVVNGSGQRGFRIDEFQDKTEYTISLWFKRLEGPVTSIGRIAGSGGGTGGIDTGDIALPQSGSLNFNGPRGSWTAAGATVAVEETVNITMYFNELTGNVKAYKNGQLTADITQSSAIEGDFTHYVIGNRADFNGEYFPAEYYVASVYDRELTLEEVMQNYEAQVSRFK